jgi:hypothetical protein
MYGGKEEKEKKVAKTTEDREGWKLGYETE